MLARPETIQLLKSLKNENANISHEVEFIFRILYNRSKTAENSRKHQARQGTKCYLSAKEIKNVCINKSNII